MSACSSVYLDAGSFLARESPTKTASVGDRQLRPAGLSIDTFRHKLQILVSRYLALSLPNLLL
jgi:hypothetical protein